MGKKCCREHTPCPANYIEWHSWAEKMLETHKQIQCKCCGLWAVWIKKGGSNG